MVVTISEQASANTMSNNIRSIANTADASSINYNNNNSSLEATNIQCAIDELNNNLTDFVKIVSAKIPSTTLSAGSFQTLSVPIAPPDGYLELNKKT